MTHLPLFDPPTIKLLTIRQPYTWLIIAGHKPVENRVWTTKYRGRLYIHAGVSMHANPISTIENKFGIAINKSDLIFGAIIGHVDLVDVVTRSESPWFDGPYGLILNNPTFIKPVPFRGRERLFDAPESILV